MAVFLAILKTIGIILLIILAIIVILLCLVLFVPVRYEASGFKHEKDIQGKARVTWLLHAVSFTIGYHADGSDGVTKELRIFGIPLERYQNFFRNLKKHRRKSRKKKRLEKIRKKNPQQYEEMKAEAAARKKAAEQKKQEEEQQAEEQQTEEHQRKAEFADSFLHAFADRTDGTEQEKTEQEETEDVKKGSGNLLIIILKAVGKITGIISVLAVKAGKKLAWIFTHLIQVITGLFHLPQKIAAALRSFFSKLKALCATIDRWVSFAKDPRTHAALKLVLKKLKKLLHHIAPKKMSGEVRFGLDDPSKTGTILAGVSALYPVYAGKVKFTPNFEEAEFSGHLEMKGRIFLYYAVYTALTVYFNKNVKYVIQFFKNVKEEKSNG